MYGKAIEANPSCTRAHSGRADLFHRAADFILLSHGIGSPHLAACEAESRELQREGRGKIIRSGAVTLGVSLSQNPVEPSFAQETIWLWERAEQDYRAELELDSTDSRVRTGLAEVLWHLGKIQDANDNLNAALAILNRAIQADGADAQSYSERAAILEGMGEIDLSIQDLERLLIVSTEKLDISFIRWEIEKLRKRKEVAAAE